MRLAASMAPSVLPAPTSICISSTKSITSPSAADISFNIAFKRSSNSPLNFAPAIKAPISSANSLLFFKLSGTSPFTIRRAIPSAIAVLPTPGSPIKTGLFFVRRLKTCIERLISSSRPMIGSILPSMAACVKSCVYFFKASKLSSAFTLSALRPFLKSEIAISNAGIETPDLSKIFLASDFTAANAHNMRSTVTNLSAFFSAKDFAFSKTRNVCVSKYICEFSEFTFGILPNERSTFTSNFRWSTPIFPRRFFEKYCSSSRITFRRC